MIAASVSRTLVEIIAIMLPAYCVYRVARYRRFSLWQLLLAPLIVILSMFAWQRLLATNPFLPITMQIVESVLSGLCSLVAAAFCVRSWVRGHYLPLAIATTLALSITLCIQSYCFFAKGYGSSTAYQMGWQHPVATFLMVAYMTFWIGGLNYFALCRFFYKRAEGKPA